MKHLRQRIARFFLRNRDKGIPNLMLWIMGISAFVYILDLADPSGLFVNLLRFDRYAILRGQVWRLVTFVFTSLCGQNLFWAVIAGLFYYQAGAALEQTWGRLRFNLYYLTGIIASVVGGLVLGFASASYLNLSLFLGFAIPVPRQYVPPVFLYPHPGQMAWSDRSTPGSCSSCCNSVGSPITCCRCLCWPTTCSILARMC